MMTFVSQVGFPIFVAGWLLLKSSKDAQMVAEALREVKTAVELLKEKVGANDK